MKTYLIDIDGTLCDKNKDHDYMKAKPNQKMIDKVNELFDAGHTIKLFTTRGTTSGIDWYEQTVAQLNYWGVKRHMTIMGKPSADVIVDDIAITFEEFLNE